MSVNYSFVKTKEELEATMRMAQNSRFFEQEKMQVYWTIEEAVARRVLPPIWSPGCPSAPP